MGTQVCPAAVVNVPVHRVWALLADPAAYDLWWDAHTDRIDPKGPARAGQTVHAHTTALGWKWPVLATVEDINPTRHQIRLRTALPLGVVAVNHIACAALGAAACRVQFG